MTAGAVGRDQLRRSRVAGAEAASLPVRRNVQLSRATTDNSSAPVRGGWTRARLAPQVLRPEKGSSGDPSDDSTSVSRPVGNPSPTAADDDGPNPLPPALEPGSAGSKQSAVRVAADPARVARAPSGSARRRSRPQDTVSLERDDSRQIDIMNPHNGSEPGSMPDELVPGGRVITPGSSGPISVDDPAGASNPVDSSANNTVQPVWPTAAKATHENSPTTTGSSDTGVAATIPAKRPTWRELTANQPDVPVDESVRRSSGEAEQPRDHALVTLTGSETRDARPVIARLLGGARPPFDPAIQKAACRFDPSERRIVDFKLPNLDGQMVSLHDLSADVVLLDFWGSWCEPCRTSIPHLTELQAKIGGKRLQVIGIACEKGSTLQDRRAAAAKASKELGITYPVLLTSKNGECPVQRAPPGPVLPDPGLTRPRRPATGA